LSVVLNGVPDDATGPVIIHQAHRLHERVGRCRSYERETASLQLLRQGYRLGGRGVPRRRAGIRFERPDESPQRAELVDDFERTLSVVDRRADLPLVPHDAGVVEHADHVVLPEQCHLLDVETGERFPKRGSFPEDCDP
jgi:hypothetical protein